MPSSMDRLMLAAVDHEKFVGGLDGLLISAAHDELRSAGNGVGMNLILVSISFITGRRSRNQSTSLSVQLSAVGNQL